MAITTIGTNGIADNIITGAKVALASQAAGDVMYYNGTDWVRVGIGTDGQVLTVNNAENAPGWEAAAGGARTVSPTNIDNALITFVNSGDTFAAEANLLYDATTLTLQKDSGRPVLDIAGYANGPNSSGLLRLRHSNNTTPGQYSAMDVGEQIGEIRFDGSDDSAFGTGATIYALSNQAWTGSAHGTRLEFRTTTDGSTSNATRMTIEDDGDIHIINELGIGTSNPNAKLHIVQTDANKNGFELQGTADNYYTFTMTNSSHTSSGDATLIMHVYENFVMINNSRYDAGGTGAYISLHTNGTVGIFTTSPSSSYTLDVNGVAHASSHSTSSDKRLKTNITELSSVLSKLDNIRAVKFDWDTSNVSEERATAYGTATEIGLIAQDIEAEFPELITKWLDTGEGHAVDNEFRAMDYGRFTSVLLAAIKELKAEVDSLKA